MEAKFHVDVVDLIKKNPPRTYSLISIDLHKFSIINDSFGSNSGDEVLAFVYKCINKFLREDEEVSRISADTFNV